MSQPSGISDLDLLEWQIAMGANEVIGDQAVDWFSVSEISKKTIRADNFTSSQTKKAVIVPPSLKKQERSPTPASAEQAADLSNDAIGDARKLAQSCNSLEELEAALADFKACPLSKTATNLCFTGGNPNANILLIGDVPERDEDLQGKLFVGRSGLLLDKLLKLIDLDRNAEDPEQAVFFTNTVFWRPPGNRKPTEAEILMCLPFVTRLIELIKPQIIVCLGGMPARRLTRQTRGITQIRGKWFGYESVSGSIPVLATLHPSFLLRQPKQKSLAWQDMLLLKQKFN